MCLCENRIPNDTLHEEHTSLLFSLEGMQDLGWNKLLQLKFPDGSFMESPSATAYAFMETKDHDCIKYLAQVVERFDGGGS